MNDYLELIKHNEKTITERSNFFLLSESFLIDAFASAYDFRFIIFIFGLILSILWLIWGCNAYSNTRILIKLSEELKDGLQENNPLKFYFTWRGYCNKGANKIYTIILPLIFIAFWLFLANSASLLIIFY